MASQTSPDVRNRTVLPLLGLLALIFAVYGPFLAGRQELSGVGRNQLSPWTSVNDAHGQVALGVAADKTLMFHPQLQLAIERGRRGEVPHWNPDNLAGVPLLAQAVHGWMHWANFPAWLMPVGKAYGWIAALQACLAAVFAYLLARKLGTEVLSASLAGVIFAFGGYMAVRAHWYQIQGASLYLPLALLCIESIFTTKSKVAVATLAAGIGSSWLAGFPQATLHILYASGAWTVVRSLQMKPPPSTTVRQHPAFLTGLGLLLGLALGAPQWLPSASLAQSGATARTPASPEEIRGLGMKPASLISLVIPEFFPHPNLLTNHASPQLQQTGALRRLLEKPGSNHIETASTIGLAGLLLAFFGMSSRSKGRRLGMGLFFLGGLLCLDTPLAAWATKLPGLDTGDPRRFLLLLHMGGAILAALGLQRFLQSGPSRGFQISCNTIAAVLLIAAALIYWISPNAWIDFLIPALADHFHLPVTEVETYGSTLLLDLELLRSALLHTAVFAALSAGMIYLGTAKNRRTFAAASLLALTAWELVTVVALPNATAVSASATSSPPPGVEWMQDPEGGRLIRFHPSPEGTLSRQPLTYPLPPNLGLPYSISDLSGYITLSPRRIERFHEILQEGSGFGVGTSALADEDALKSPLLDRAAVSRIVSSTALSLRDISLLGKSSGVWFYRRNTVLPRARVSDDWIAVKDESSAEAQLKALSLPTPTVIEDPDGLLAAPPPRHGPPGSAHIITDLPERVEIEVANATQGSLLVLSDSFMPGWTAQIDDHPAPILPVDLAFRGVPLPPGDHRVTFLYATPGWKEGKVLGFLGLLGVALCLVTERRHKRGHPDNPRS